MNGYQDITRVEPCKQAVRAPPRWADTDVHCLELTGLSRVRKTCNAGSLQKYHYTYTSKALSFEVLLQCANTIVYLTAYLVLSASRHTAALGQGSGSTRSMRSTCCRYAALVACLLMPSRARDACRSPASPPCRAGHDFFWVEALNPVPKPKPRPCGAAGQHG